MSKRVLVVGGVNSNQVKSGEGWAAYKAGRVVRLDLETGWHEEVIYDGDIPEYIPKNANISTVFKAATLNDQKMLLCTTTEVFERCLMTGNVLRSVSHPKFNDVHHAIYDNDNVLVVSTGLDSLILISWQGEIIKTWPLSEKARRMLDDDIDYRAVESTKPHDFHPNFVFKVGERIYLTRFKQGDAICVNDEVAPRLVVTKGNIHDGLVHRDKTWFTCTNGWLCAVSNATGNEAFSVDLNALYEGDAPLGWCRGLEFLGDDLVAVGFSRLRHTKFKEHVKWAVSKFSDRSLAPLPTRVAVIDLVNKTVLDDFVLEGREGLNAIFSIHLDEIYPEALCL